MGSTTVVLAAVLADGVDDDVIVFVLVEVLAFGLSLLTEL
jgi:hypothetical protein